MKDYIALVTVELHKFARQIAGGSSGAGGGSGRCVGWGLVRPYDFSSSVLLICVRYQYSWSST
jgi:hypothetical protein